MNLFNKYQFIFSTSTLFYFFYYNQNKIKIYKSNNTKDLIYTGPIELENQLIFDDFYYLKRIFKSILFGSLNTSLFICVKKFIIPKLK